MKYRSQFTALFFSVLIALPMLWSYFQTEITSLNNNRLKERLIFELRQRHTQVIKNTLLTHSGIYPNFDQISFAQKQMDDSLLEFNRFFDATELREFSLMVSNALVELRDEVEYFKTIHAKIANSLRYLPKKYADSMLQLDSGQHVSEEQVLMFIHGSLLTLRLFDDESVMDPLKSSIAELKRAMEHLPDSAQYELGVYLSHAKMYLSFRDVEKSTLKQILNNHFSIRLSLMQGNMAEQRESSLESNRELKNYLSYYSIFLLLVVFVFLVNRNRLLGIAKSNKALSEIDQLTGLMNRRHFLQQLEASLLQKKDIGGAVIFVDLDGFKPINDQLGHNAGDEILKIMSTRLLNIATHHQHEGVGFYVARLGGDEFVILLDCLAKIDIEKVASEVADSIVQTCSAQLPSLYTLYPLSASVGVAFYPTHACEIIELLHCADQAMYQSKRKGKNRYTIHQNNVP